MNRIQKDKIARNPETNQATLRELAEDSSNKVRAAVAINPVTPEDVLLTLATDPHMRVVQKTASNKAMTLKLATKLMNYPSSIVLATLIRNPKTPLTIKKKILATNDYVAKEEAKVLANDPEFKDLFATHKNAEVRASFMTVNENIDYFHKMKKDNYVVKHAMALNPATPAEVIKWLAEQNYNKTEHTIIHLLMAHKNMPAEKVVAYYADHPAEITNVIVNNLKETLPTAFLLKNWNVFSYSVRYTIANVYDSKELIVEALLDPDLNNVMVEKLFKTQQQTNPKVTYTEPDEYKEYKAEIQQQIIRQYVETILPNQKNMPYEWVYEIASTMKPSNLLAEEQA